MEPADIPSIDDVLISNDDLWEAAPQPRYVEECISMRRYGIFLTSGDTASHPVPCNMWDCQRCAEPHAEREVLLVRLLTKQSKGAFFASVPDSEFEAAKGRMSDRRHQMAKKAERVWYRWYRRSDGIVWIIASHPLGGRKPPVEFHPTDDPLRLAAMAVRLPGVLRADGSNLGDLMPDDDDDHEDGEGEPPVVGWIGTAGPEGWDGIKVAAAAEAKRRFGYDVDPVYPLTMPGGLSIEQWVEVLRVVRYQW